MREELADDMSGHAGLLHVQGAGPKLAYEIVRPPGASAVLRGAESLVSSPEGLADLQRRLPRCEVREIPGGSHLLLLEYPERVAKAIREFLQGKAVGQVMSS